MNRFNQLLQVVLPIAKLASVVAVFVFLSLIIQAQFDQKTTLEKQLSQLTELQENARITAQYVDSLKKEISTYQTRASVAQSQANRLGSEVNTMKKESKELLTFIDSLKHAAQDSTELARTVIPAQDTLIRHQEKIIVKQDTQVVQLTKALVLKDSSNMLLMKSNHKLSIVVDSLVTLKMPKNPNKWWIFKLPSRKATAVASAAGGAIATLIVVNR